MGKTLEKTLENLDGYLISISRNVDTTKYQLEVGFRKNWVYKSTDNINCEIKVNSDNGSIVIISSKHDDIIIDDLIEFVNNVIYKNKKITEMQNKFEKQLEDQAKIMEDQIMEFAEQLEEYKESTFDSEEKVENTEEKVENTEIVDDELD